MFDNILDIKVIPDPRHFIYASFSRICISNGYLENVSDHALVSALYHELHHIQHRKEPVFYFLIITAFVVEMLFFIPSLFYFPLFFGYYLFSCAFIRHFEIKADLFALVNTDMFCMFCFFCECRDRENGFLKIFFLLRWHPSINKRYNIVNNYNLKVLKS